MVRNILWFDNDSAYLIPFVDALKDEGYEVKVAETLTEAEQLLKSTHYDLMILDVMIPTMDEQEEVRYKPAETDLGYKTGLLFFINNKAQLDSTGTKVIVMTVRLDKAIMDEFIKAGLPPEAYATKYEMSDPTSFLNKIQKVLGETQQPTP